MAKVSARGDRELERTVFEDGFSYILTERGRILLRYPFGRIRLMYSPKMLEEIGLEPKEAYRRLIKNRQRQVPVKEVKK